MTHRNSHQVRRFEETMMSLPNNTNHHHKICILPQQVVEQIAAGEAIQRPAAAMKESIENSLDANATKISVQTDGIQTITITDNVMVLRKMIYY